MDSAAEPTAAASAPQIIILSPRQSPSPAPDHRTSLTRLASLSNYLLARRRASSSSPPQPPTDQPDWTALVTQSDQQIQEEVQRLIVEERAFTEREQEGERRAEEAASFRQAEVERLTVVSGVLGLDFSSTGGVSVLGGEEAEEEAEQQALFVESLRAGGDSRARRLARRQSRAPVAEREDDEEDYTAFQQFLTDEMDRQEMLFGEDRAGGGEQEQDEEEDPWIAWNEQQQEGPARDSQGRRIWRNTPISIPRVTPNYFPFPTSITTRAPHPPSPNSNNTLNLPPSSRPRMFPNLIPSAAAAAEDGDRADRIRHRLRTLAALASPFDDPEFTLYEPPPPPRPPVPARRIYPATPSDLPSYLSRLPPRPPQIPTRSTLGQRTRKQTTTLMGRTLRMKKGVWALYCGGGGKSGSGGEEELPSGFRWPSSSSEEGEAEGCGALVCARALKEGQKRLFVDPSGQGHQEEAISTDLPLSSTRVGSLDSEGRKTVYTGRGCEGCEVREVGCRACGNPLAYLLLQPCPSCPSQHPPSIGGGAMMDGLLWHFRAGAVRARPRLVGREVLEWWEEGEVEEESEAESEERERKEGERIEPRSPKIGEQMKWRELPSAQAEFEASLIGEPSEWTRSTPNEEEEWWIVNGVAKHCPPPPPSDESSTLAPLHPPLSSSSSGDPLPTTRDPFEVALEMDLNQMRGDPPAPSRYEQQHALGPGIDSSGIGARLSRSPAIRISPSRMRARDQEDEEGDEGEGRRARRRLENGSALRDRLFEREEGVGYGSAYVGRSAAESRRRRETSRAGREGRSVRAGR